MTSASQASQRALDLARLFVEHSERLNARYRAGDIHVHVPAALMDDAPLEELLAQHCQASERALREASQSLFFSLPLAFDPSESVGPYLAVLDRDPAREPYRWLDLGALIATQAFGENEPTVVNAILQHLAFAVGRYAHSEYQTVLSLQLKARLSSLAPHGTPRHFVVNTGAEAVENAMKSVLLNRVRTVGDPHAVYFLISFEGAFHGRTLGCLAVTQRKKARVGFPTFDWPAVPFPFNDPASPAETRKREDKTLRLLWDLLVTARQPNVVRNKDSYLRDMTALEAMLVAPREQLPTLLTEARAKIPEETLRRAQRVAGVLIEPIQGEGGVREARPRFFQLLRLLTRLYHVPLLFDEVQTGWGVTGTLWAHEQFDLPFPPDIVTWAKKAQNGILFVSEELATFFQEEKKFNTTWEGDSVGMVRLLALMDRLDLEETRKTGAQCRAGLERLATDFPGFLQGVRGAGCMLGFDVVRPDWRDALRDRAFRLGLLLLPAGERTLRFYPRYNMEPYAVEEALLLLRRAVESIVQGQREELPRGPERRLGLLDVPIAGVQWLDLSAEWFHGHAAELMAIETERYGAIAQYPANVLREGRRPLLQYPREVLEATAASARSVGVGVRDRVSRRLVAYALGSVLEGFDEEGVRDDGHHGEGVTYYLQALALLPSVRNARELQTALLNELRKRVEGAGYERFAALIERRVVETGPMWVVQAPVLRTVENYLGSGICFVYLSTALGHGLTP
ncbi:MAG: aminotransferase class III-fold pyridoxal phosphate-dependent enzyme [Myxococcales bacterium]|jgi:4-aminobutyrate aminotransferase-like enzyme